MHACVTCMHVYVCTCMCMCAGVCTRPRPQVRGVTRTAWQEPAGSEGPAWVRGGSFVTGGRGAVPPLQAWSTGSPRPTLPSHLAPQLPGRPPLCLHPHPYLCPHSSSSPTHCSASALTPCPQGCGLMAFVPRWKVLAGPQPVLGPRRRVMSLCIPGSLLLCPGHTVTPLVAFEALV